jgi:transposase-like protein
MSPGHPRDPRKEQFWRDHLRRWQQAGGTVRAYCRRHGLAEASFHGWRRTLAQRDRASQPPVTFVPVHLRHEAPATPLELILGDGRCLRIPAGFAPDSLRAVLAVLEGAPC